VTEESTNSAARDTDSKQIQQEDFQPALGGSTTAVQAEMAGSDDDRQDGESEDADRNTVHASASSTDGRSYVPAKRRDEQTRKLVIVIEARRQVQTQPWLNHAWLYSHEYSQAGRQRSGEGGIGRLGVQVGGYHRHRLTGAHSLQGEVKVRVPRRGGQQ
jgi:hypothetical protein